VIGILDSSVLEKDSAQILFLFKQSRTFEADRRQTDRQDRNRRGKWECAMPYLHFTFMGRQVYVETLFDYGVHELLLYPLKRFSPQSTYRGRGEIGEGSLSALSAGGYTTTLYVMVTIVKWGGRATPTHTSLG